MTWREVISQHWWPYRVRSGNEKKKHFVIGIFAENPSSAWSVLKTIGFFVVFHSYLWCQWWTKQCSWDFLFVFPSPLGHDLFSVHMCDSDLLLEWTGEDEELAMRLWHQNWLREEDKIMFVPSKIRLWLISVDCKQLHLFAWGIYLWIGVDYNTPYLDKCGRHLQQREFSSHTLPFATGIGLCLIAPGKRFIYPTGGARNSRKTKM